MGRRESPATPAPLAPQDLREPQDFQAKTDFQDCLEAKATKAMPASQAFRAWSVSRENLDFQDSLAWTVNQAFPVFRVIKENRALQTSSRVKRASGAKGAFLAYQDRRATPVHPASQDLKAKLAGRVRKVPQAQWVRWVPRVTVVCKARQVCRACQALKASLETRAPRVFPAATT